MSASEELAKGAKILIVVFGIIFGLAFALAVIPQDRFDKIVNLIFRSADKAKEVKSAIPHEPKKESHEQGRP
jgi:hypothetical protein